ncbi:MAG: cytochrome c [Saprospiraceae bacterium]|nr:cytochrome c [Saprospiraceae bacterium]
MNNKLALYYFCLFFCACSLSPETYKQGKALYLTHCASCHGNSMEGLGQLYPALSNYEKLIHKPDELACLIYHGKNNTTENNTLGLSMPAFQKLSAIEINNILNYMNASHWKLPEFPLDQTETRLNSCK